MDLQFGDIQETALITLAIREVFFDNSGLFRELGNREMHYYCI